MKSFELPSTVSSQTDFFFICKTPHVQSRKDTEMVGLSLLATINQAMKLKQLQLDNPERCGMLFHNKGEPFVIYLSYT